ncbi:L10-interacting MYB domain-containing protein [Quercus suber]|uniref:L10-interacting MYB domain-containing protein n=1 Tax=Quercus suber TaxID=58331 RepID=UPI000D28A8C8|nr:l10-interacting myb domain-containing protein [Quercus suber]
MELASSSSVFAPSSSSSSNDVTAPNMADPSAAEDLKLLWPAPVEKQFIDLLLEEKDKGNIPNAKMKKKHWPFVTEVFIQRTGNRYSLEQITEKFKWLKKRYIAFSQLIGITEMEWDPDTNTVTCSDEAWSDVMKLNPRCNDFHKKGLDHYELLRQLFHTVAQTSSAQHVSADDVDEQGSNPKGKQPAHSGTSTGKKRKAGSLATESRKTVESAQVPDPYSMAKATKILNSMSDFNNETFYKALTN